MSKEDLIVTRNGVPFEDQMEGIRQFKEAAFKAAEKARLPQDVEEFIADRQIYGDDPFSSNLVVPVDDLRAWMSGHVRVPVNKIDKAIKELGYLGDDIITSYQLLRLN